MKKHEEWGHIMHKHILRNAFAGALENHFTRSDLNNHAEIITTTTLLLKWVCQCGYACNLYFWGNDFKKVSCRLTSSLDWVFASYLCIYKWILLKLVGSQSAVAGMLLLFRPLHKHKLPPSVPHSSALPPLSFAFPQHIADKGMHVPN